MKIINIVDSLDKVNFGIWNAAISTAHILKSNYGIESELWYPKTSDSLHDIALFNGCILREIGTFNPTEILENNSIIVSHGCWQIPTRLAYKLKKSGFPWMYIPHGMLEPWSMQQKKMQKQIYFKLIEGRFSKKANEIRAVGKPEFDNLSKIYKKNLYLIPNGSEMSERYKKNFYVDCKSFLFMARLHHKKGIKQLVQAWIDSSLNNSSKYKLNIAGPDEGELQNIELLLKKSNNIHYLGPQYGENKQKLLDNSHFYILPSFSEGFPTSVVEAMSYGLIPLITQGCNFPEAFDNNVAIKINPEIISIKNGLEYSVSLNTSELEHFSTQTILFAKNNYSLEKIAAIQYEHFTKLLAKK